MADSSFDPDVTPRLTPRLDRIEHALVDALVSGATRSELRDIVHRYADLLRLQGTAPERTIAGLEALVRRAAPRIPAHVGSIPGDSPDDRLALIVRWCSARLARADHAGSSARVARADDFGSASHLGDAAGA